MVSLTIDMKSNEWFSIQLPPSVEVHAWFHGTRVLSVPLSLLTCLQLEVMIRRERERDEVWRRGVNCMYCWGETQ